MAKLSHPNVIGVYDVEERSDGTFVLVITSAILRPR